MKANHLLYSAVAIAALVCATPASAQRRGGGSASGGASRGGGRVVGHVAPPSTTTGGGVRVAPRVIGPGIGPGFTTFGHFVSPYYVFTPSVNLGFGLWVGNPVAYPYLYGYPYAYNPYYYSTYGTYPYGAYPSYGAYPYGTYSGYGYAVSPAAPGTVPPPAAGSVDAQPGAAGGLSFDVMPSTTEVFIDGNDQGPASSFTSSSEPLTLPAGRHHLELRAPGYETMVFDVDVLASQVIPYQGTLQTEQK